jgi:hypothetical protein
MDLNLNGARETARSENARDLKNASFERFHHGDGVAVRVKIRPCSAKLYS